MDLYVVDAELDRIEIQARSVEGNERLEALTALAWHLRQRDSERALSLAAEAEQLLPESSLSPAAISKTLCRLVLVRAEVAALFGNFEFAETQLATLRGLLDQTPDDVLEGDGHLVEAALRLESGEADREFASYQAARDVYLRTGDVERLAISKAWAVSRHAIDNPAEAEVLAGELEAEFATLDSPAFKCLIGTARFRQAYSSNPARAVAICIESSDLALSVGMVRIYIVYRFNIGMSLFSLGEIESSSSWVEQSLDRARQAAWPAQVGLGQILLGTLARQRGDLQRARELLEDAIAQFPATSTSINKVIGYSDLGSILIELERYDEARTALEKALQLGRRGRQTLTVVTILNIYARALSKGGDPKGAIAALDEAREAIERFDIAPERIELNKALAEIYQRHPEHAGDKGDWPNATISVLEQSMTIGSALSGWKPDLPLLLSLRDAWTEAGDLTLALRYSNLAFERERELSRETTAGRLAFIEERHELERARAEAEHHRELAATASETSHTLDHLGRIGQEITASLNTDRVFEALYRNLGNLVDAPTLSVFLLEQDNKSLTMRFGMEEGGPLPTATIPLDSPTSNAARCIRERREVLMLGNAVSATPSRMHMPGTQRMQTALFGPLIVGDRILGALSIQSPRENAYQERERLVFRTLCAYGAIALDNADAYRQLQAAQQAIVLQEKMAGLGTLTAGVAHEINNPANFAHAGAQLLAEEIMRLRAFLLALAGDDADTEVLDEIGRRFDGLSVHVGTIREGTTRIRDLVKDLRSFSRLDESARKSARLSESLAATLNLVRTQYADIAEFQLDMRDDPLIECWPALLNQVFMNLIVNACQAIKAKYPSVARDRAGLVKITSWIDDSMLALEFADNGIGMSRETLTRVFEPFFTTKDVGEGTGLGMSISFGIINKHQGVIEASSVEGEGTRFLVKLPLEREPATLEETATT
jgi:signal transduction histidine kinase